MKKNKIIKKELQFLQIYHYNIPSEDLTLHNHEEAQLIIPLLGNSQIQLKNKTINVVPGQIIILNSFEEHAFFANDATGERLVCYIDANKWKEKINSNISGVYQLPQFLKELILYIFLNDVSSLESQLMEVLLFLLLDVANLYKIKNLKHNTSDEKINQFIHLIKENFNKKINFKDFSEKNGFSQRDLNRKFLKLTGGTPKDFQTQLRIDYATKLLQKKTYSVTEISLMVGYQSLSQFIEVFKKLTGKIPSDYRVN